MRVRNDELPESTHETSPMVVVIIAGVVTVFLVGMLIRLLYPPTRSSATRGSAARCDSIASAFRRRERRRWSAVGVSV